MVVKINSRKMQTPLPQKDSAVQNLCVFAVRIQHLLETSSGTLVRVCPNKNPPFSGFRAGLVWSPDGVTSHIWLCLIFAQIWAWAWAWHWLIAGAVSKALAHALNGCRNVPAQFKAGFIFIVLATTAFYCSKKWGVFFASGTGVYNVLPLLSEFKLCII